MPKKSKSSFKKELTKFLKNPKEINELFQVTDEELKIISKLCPDEGNISGPYLRETSSVIHTEYKLEGKGFPNLLYALRESLFAATMVGSPLENAARIIKKYEKHSRRYYASVIALFGKDKKEYLDSAITIRTTEIDNKGNFTVQVGASIVRDSVPKLECNEVKAKIRGMLNAITKGTPKKEEYLPGSFDNYLQRLLNSRNKYLSKFWIQPIKKHGSRHTKCAKFVGLIDNGDDFVYMIQHMLNCMGYKNKIIKYNNFKYDKQYDIVLIGPGPGDPNNLKSKKMEKLYSITQELLKKNVKVLGVCLGHQILAKALGFSLSKSIIPFQGMQKQINLFGKNEKVGFYNSFFAMCNKQVKGIKVLKDNKGKVYALKGKNFISYQFHVESILTQNGFNILQDAVEELIVQ